MPTYDYRCTACQHMQEVQHMMSEEPRIKCEECGKKAEMMISTTFHVAFGTQGSIEDRKAADRQKKIKDPERARRMRKKLLGSQAVGDPPLQDDPRHKIKRRVLKQGGATVDKKEFIQKSARNPKMVEKAQKILKKQRGGG